MRKIKAPLCENCQNKLYVVNIRRDAIGYICPDCDYHFIKYPAKQLAMLRNKIKELKENKPTFKQRVYTICEKCRETKFIKCRKNTKKPFKGCGFGPNTWVCWCTNPKHKEHAWSQNVPKIVTVPYYKKSL